MGFISVLSRISRWAGHTTPLLPFPSPGCHLSHMLRKTNGIKRSVNVFLQFRKVKGFASLFQGTRGIQPFCQHSSEHQTAADSSEEGGPLTKGWVEKTRLEDYWGTNTPSAGAVTSVSAAQLEGCALCLLRRTQDCVNPPAMKKYLVFTWLSGVENQSHCCHKSLQTMAGGSWGAMCGMLLGSLATTQSSAKPQQSLKGSIQ